MRLLLPVMAIAVMLSLSITGGIAAQNPNSESMVESATSSDADVDNADATSLNPKDSPSEPVKLATISIQVGDKAFLSTLFDNPSARALIARLPFTLLMKELNGNEKYYFFAEPLPSNSSQIGNIQTGDLMLYGSDALVLFYKSFSTSYSYTRLGRINDTTSLAQVLGSGSVSVTFSLVEEQ